MSGEIQFQCSTTRAETRTVGIQFLFFTKTINCPNDSWVLLCEADIRIHTHKKYVTQYNINFGFCAKYLKTLGFMKQKTILIPASNSLTHPNICRFLQRKPAENVHYNEFNVLQTFN